MKSIPSYKSAVASRKKMLGKSIYPAKKPYQYCGGDWGEGRPLYTIKKIMKVGKNTYDVTVTNKFGVRGEKEKLQWE